MNIEQKRRERQFMKLRSTAVLLTVTGFMGAATHSIAALNDIDGSMTANANVPVPKLQKSIDLTDLGPETLRVHKMTFSPDGRYLAIVEKPNLLKIDFVVWDLQLDRMQSHIHYPFTIDLTNQNLLWSRDGKVISFGAKKQWDAMTGEALPDNPAVGGSARLNMDGSKMLTIVGEVFGPNYIHIYDTRTWALQKVYVDGLAVQTAAWTAEDKILVGVRATKETIGKTIDGYTITHGPDVALRLLDPTGKEPTKAVWFPAIPDDRPRHSPWTQAIDVALSASNFSANQVALGAGRIINGKTMEILTYFSIEDILSNKVSTGTGGMTFSPNGKYLFLKAGTWFDGRKPVINTIVDTTTGRQVAQFGGGDSGIAVNTDGKQLAIGNRHSVQILSL
jgi:WD40 repeat protein